MYRKTAYIKFIWSRYKALMIFAMIFIAAVQFLLIYFNSTMDVAPMIELFLSQLPPQVREMYGEMILNQISLEGTIAFGLEHPLVTTLFIFLSISITSSNIASGSENKDIEILLSHPFSRRELISTLYFFAIFSIFMLILSAFSGAMLAINMYHEAKIDMTIMMLKSNINALFLHVFILSYSMFFSVYFKDVSKAIRWAAIISFVFYFLNVISTLWKKLEFTNYFNFFSYFNPNEIMTSRGNPTFDILFLGIGSFLLFVLSFRIFIRKDIS